MHRFIWIAASVLLLACASDQPEASSPVPVSTRPAAPEAAATLPPPTPTPAATATPSVIATSEPAQPRPTAAPRGNEPTRPAGPIAVRLRALNLAFSERTLSFPAGVSATLVLENDDLSVLHDIGVSLPGVGHSEACSGPCTTSVSFTAQAPGRYTFFCSIHADMVGDLIVTP